MATLYELTAEMQRIMDSEDISDTDLQTAFGNIQEKAQNICQLVTMLEHDAEVFKAEETRLAERRKAIENRASNIKEYIKRNMIEIEIDEIKAGIFSLKLQDNPPAVEVTNEASIPARYYTIIPETKQLDKKRLGTDLKAGSDIPGCKLTTGKSLRIR